MPLKQGKSRWAISLDDDSETLAKIDQVCRELETTRAEATRYILVAWSKSWNGNVATLGLSSTTTPSVLDKPQTVEVAKAPSKRREVKVNDAAIDALDLMD